MKYIKLNDAVKEFVDNKMRELKIESRRILAVSVRRGVEWVRLNAHLGMGIYGGGEGIVLDRAINKTKQLLNDWNCDYIFLSIDDYEGLNIFKDTFGERLLYFERRRSVLFKNGLPLSKDNVRLEYERLYGSAPTKLTQDERFEKELNYLTEVYIMANATCFYGMTSSANRAAVAINGGKFENLLIDKGEV